jgi:hypothetical protein
LHAQTSQKADPAPTAARQEAAKKDTPTLGFNNIKDVSPRKKSEKHSRRCPTGTTVVENSVLNGHALGRLDHQSPGIKAMRLTYL